MGYIKTGNFIKYFLLPKMIPYYQNFIEDGARIIDFHGSPIIVYKNRVEPNDVARKIADFKTKEEDDESFAVVDLKMLLDRVKQMKEALPGVEPHYAYKCNNDPVIVRILANLRCGFDCASRDEIEYVLENNLVDSSKIVYSNTVKTPSYVKYASKMGVNLMTFDNGEELMKIKKLHENPRLLLRIYANDNFGKNSYGKKFGCDPISEGPKLLEAACSLGLQVVGISFHVGIGFSNTDDTCQSIKEAKKLFEIGQNLGHNMDIFDIGGAFPGSPKMGKLSFEKITTDIKIAIDENFPSTTGIKIISEPGRFFVASAVSVCVNVIAATKVKGSRIFENPSNPDQEAYMYYVNDGNFGSFSGRLFDNYTPSGEPLMDPMDALDREEYPCVIYGPTMNGADKIEVKGKMRKLNVGEWLIYDDMGAYTKVIGTTFNGFRQPKYFYFVDEETWSKISQSSK